MRKNRLRDSPDDPLVVSPTFIFTRKCKTPRASWGSALEVWQTQQKARIRKMRTRAGWRATSIQRRPLFEDVKCRLDLFTINLDCAETSKMAGARRERKLDRSELLPAERSRYRRRH